MEISLSQISVEILGFVFYLYELYAFTHHESIISPFDHSAEVFFLRLILLFLALPLLYLFRVANFFDWGDGLSDFLAGLFKFENSNTFFQVKLFYRAINVLLTILAILEAINYLYKYFHS